MKLLIKDVLVIDPQSKYNKQRLDIRIHDGELLTLEKGLSLEDGEQLIEGEDLGISPSWVDMHADLAEPGNEHRETIASGLAAAEAGGFGYLVQMPSTQPIVQSKSDVEYLINKSEQHQSQLLVAGAATRDLAGDELTEMFDMKQSGAKFFTNDKSCIQKTDVLELAIRYAYSVNSFLACLPMDRALSKGGQMIEGAVSTSLGVKGIPRIAESIALDRVIRLAKANDCPVHIMSVSTKDGVELIKQAQEEGVDITADVNAVHLLYSDEDLRTYDTNLKLFPALGNDEDRKALKAAVLDGTIGMISADHRPIEIEGKQCEFDLASFGMIGLQTCFSVCLEAFGKQGIDLWLPALFNARQLLKLPEVSIEEGATSDFTLFHMGSSSMLNKENNLSLSNNSYFLGKELAGKVVGLV